MTFRYKEDKSNSKQYGLIAEEVLEVNPDFVSYNENNEPETVSYSHLITPMLKAIQEQQEIIENQQEQINLMRSEMAEMKEAILAVSSKQ